MTSYDELLQQIESLIAERDTAIRERDALKLELNTARGHLAVAEDFMAPDEIEESRRRRVREEALIAERDTAIRELDALRNALRIYGEHHPDCAEPCDCGLDAALKDAP